MSLPDGFNPAPDLIGPTLSLSALRGRDIAPLCAAASDPQIWAGHPARNRHDSEVFVPYAERLLAAGGTLVARAGGRVVGMSRFYAAPDQMRSIAVGFTFLIRDLWGGLANAEMKALMLHHAFAHVGEVWLHIAPGNARSKAASGKLGARHRYDAVLDHSGAPSQSCCYAITRQSWRDSPACARMRAAGMAVPDYVLSAS